MIKFHIPGITKHFEINIKLIDLMNSNPEYFYDDIYVSGIYGSFFCPWNGGRGNDVEPFEEPYRENIINEFNKRDVAILFTFTNTVLEKRDLYDLYGNQDLKLISRNPINKVILVSDLLKEYIAEKYPSIQLVSSIASCNTRALDEGYDIKVINANYNNTNELMVLNDKNKIELLVNSNCIKNCPYEQEHYDSISYNNVEKYADFFECPYDKDGANELSELMKSELFITVEDLYGKYKEAGFSMFKINGRHATNKDVISYYLYYMVKEEYKDIVKEELYTIANIKG